MDQNERRYNQLWTSMDVCGPEHWSSWKVIREIMGEKNLEIGSGNYPRIPVRGGYFLDISKSAVANLKRLGAKAFVGSVENMDFPDNLFDLAVAIDVIEHVDDDKKAFWQISRVLKPQGLFLFSAPLIKEKFSDFDRIAGHKRRYVTGELVSLISKNGFKLVKWSPPNLRYWGFQVLGRLPITRNIFLKVYSNKKSFKFFGLPKFFVNFLVRFNAFIDRISWLKWNYNAEKLKNFKGDSVIILCQKEKKMADFGKSD